MRRIFLVLLAAAPVLAGPKTETYKGKVLSVEEDYCSKSIDYVVQATIVTEKQGNVVVHVAPAP